MGKATEDRQPEDPEAGISGPDTLCRCSKGFGGIGRAFSFRCALVLLLSTVVFLSALFLLPPFHTARSSSDADHSDKLSAPIQASFVLEGSVSFLSAHTGRLEYDIFEEIGVPNTKVSVISMHPITSSNSTYVVFGVLPDPKYATISSVVLSVMRSSLIELFLQQSNLSLTPYLFGKPSSFEVLKFPGGITVIPTQSAPIWQITQILFNFTLNNSILQIEKNLDELKDQLKYGLNLRSFENVYVQMTNENGSTIAPPVTVQASVLSDVGSRSLLPPRLKQLAQIITGSPVKNLGLNHSVFGKVKEVSLSSYLNHSITSLGSPIPSPSPSPADKLPISSPVPVYPTFPPSYASAPSTDHDHLSPCIKCGTFSPSGSPFPHAPAPEDRTEPPSPSPSPSPSPAPSMTTTAPALRRSPCLAPSLPPNGSPTLHPDPPAFPDYPPPVAAPSPHRTLGPASAMTPHSSALRPIALPDSSPPQEASVSPAFAPSNMSPAPYSNVAANPYFDAWLVMFLGFLMFHVLC